MTILNSRVIRISAASLLTGLLIGVVGGLFQLLLIAAERLRNELVAWSHGSHYLGWVAPLVAAAVCAAIARWMVVRFAPEAAGSGVHRVEAVFRGEIEPAKAVVLPVKFIGGIIAIGSGLALGREGPTVQMGASIAESVSRSLIKTEADLRVIDAAGAGAGLAVAFNAPLGGAIFVFEELTSSFTPWLLVATLAAATLAVWVGRLLLGNHFDFNVSQLSMNGSSRAIWPVLLLGVLMGVIGSLYNLAIIRSLHFGDVFSRLTSVQRAAIIGAVIGLAAWFAPTLVGGGDNITQSVLSGNYAVEALIAIFVFRFFIGPFSYMAGTPGGLFAPMLLLGASFGALFGEVLHLAVPTVGISPLACAVIGMGTLFSACVRAPLTGIMLTVEMTGRGDLTLDLLAASLMAIVLAMLLNSEPIYESLKKRLLEQQQAAQREHAQQAAT